ncbi:hypothetical protein [Paenibacillus physcomitrellae]|uniref:Uncharacterized protein n=1 Tax=Paenibacillus physcomitrellae TaxID=1619311 RepID=A0ABQ1FZ60_9BACL|nr:hypothetical protein [Paenibacillus physcomitrellae]GGA32087.1 hypothetical protein GCM10010917_16560 [Paenibacillus physcomitrellae]
MSDFGDFNVPTNPGTNDPYALKANHDVNQHNLHHHGAPGLWRQISNQFIALAIFAAIIGIIILLNKIF